MNKHAVIAVLEEYGLLLDLAGENPFKVRAYTNGARALEGFDGPWPAAVTDGSLETIKGIGPGLRADIKALVQEGQLPAYEQLKAATPAGLLDILEIPGLGAKKVKAIHEGLGISSVGELEYACLENRLVDLPGFGEKTQAKILKSIAHWKANRDKRLYADALELAEAARARATAIPGVSRVEVAGALRRKLEIVDELRLVVAAADPAAVSAALGEGVTEGGLPVVYHVVAPERFGSQLLEATGSADFVGGLPAGWQGHAEEEAAFAAVQLPPVPPELREAAGARAGPVLVDNGDLQGVFHVHTRYSDGEASVKDMALRAKQLGFSYIGISDHSQAAAYAHGLKAEAIAQQRAEIAALNAELDGITILHGIEADILQDGSLDYDDETLAGLDFVIGSVHSRFGQDRDAMTARLVKALENPHLTMLGHLTGRLLLSREAYDFDLQRILDTAARHGKVIELNANPHRLDLDWRDLPGARRLGIPISINPDAHSPEGLTHTRFGVAVARKGGLEARDVFNARPLEAVRAFLRKG